MSTADYDAAARRRKRLKFRSWHRGTKELDLLLGPFADACLDAFDEPLLIEYERLLEQPEPDLFEWILGGAAAPASVPCRALAQIVAFHAARRRR